MQVTINVTGEGEGESETPLTRDEVSILVTNRVNEMMHVVDWESLTRICEMADSLPQTIERIVSETMKEYDSLQKEEAAAETEEAVPINTDSGSC